jgi:hypothetical protein
MKEIWLNSAFKINHLRVLFAVAQTFLYEARKKCNVRLIRQIRLTGFKN